jgi:hypothetical protein
MFDLTGRIQDWRASLTGREELREGDLDELEGHLRDSVERLLSFGLSEEEALLVALHRLGRPEALTAEFHKTNGGSIWGRRLLWMLMGYLVVPLLLVIGSLVANTAVLLGVQMGFEGDALAYLNGSAFLVSMAAWIALAATLTRGSSSRLRESLDRSLAWLGARRYVALGGIVALVWLVKAIAMVGSSTLLGNLQSETLRSVFASPVQLMARLLSVAAFIGLILHTRRRLRPSRT